MEFTHPYELLDHVGAEIGVSSWLTVDQARINAFAKIAGKPEAQWIHLDAERAARELPDGRPIAHGYLLLSLFTRLTAEFFRVGQVRHTLNCGLDRLRFTAPVPAGARVRLRQTIGAAEKAADGGVRLALDGVLEVEHGERPAVVARTLRVIYP